MPQPIRTVSVGDAAASLGSEPRPVLVDVREVNEHRAVRIPGALLMPLSTFAVRYRELPTDRPILVLCAHGQRSFAAADFLARNGYADAASIDGGIVAWERGGHPVARGPIPAAGDDRVS